MGLQSPSVSRYEQSREERIKENLQRLQKLGIADISKELNSFVRPKRTPKSSRSTPSLPPPPIRRSSRLQKTTPVCYSELELWKKVKSLKMPEVYTGKSCHHCRQRTLDHHTQCSKCNMVLGQFCGRCLRTRYGERLHEALKNPNWICPVCRGICNCSFCRRAEGLCPTGSLYKKISRQGFKSVAHYLMQTECAQSTFEESPETVSNASGKRPLPFSGIEALLKDSSEVNGYHLTERPKSEDAKDDNHLDIENETPCSSYPSTNHQNSINGSLLFSVIEEESKNMDSVQNQFGMLKPQLEDRTDNGCKGEEEKKLHHSGNNSNIALVSHPKSQRNCAASVPNPDSIAGRLRLRRKVTMI